MFKLVMILLLASCAGPKNPANCVTKHDEKFLGEKLSTILSTVKGSPVTLKEINRSCHKIKYQAFDNVHVVIYRLPGMTKTLSSTVNYAEPAEQNACWEKAISDVMQIDQDGRYQQLLDSHKKMHSFEWQDLDIGPSKWVKCGLNNQEVYFGSLVTLLHEVNHEIKKFDSDQVCLYMLEDKEYLCFEFDTDLPRRSLGKLDLNIIPHDAGRDMLMQMQDVYLLNIDQEIWSLLDELNAYGITMRAMTRILEVRGLDHVVTEGKRNFALVTMFQLIVKRYFERLKEKNPEAYQQILAKNKENLKVLLKSSNDSYTEWVRVLGKFNEKEKKAEVVFRKLFTHASPFYNDLGWSPK